MKSAATDSDEHRKLRDRVLRAALPHIAFEGWTAKAARMGAASAGLSKADAVRAFPGGGRELLAHFSDWADRQMLAALAKRELDTMRVRERIALAVRKRLEPLTPYREAERRAVALLALPHNAPVAARALYRTVDRIWRACGDTATDFSFYTKRGLLAGVYVATLMYWLNDTSEGSDSSWAFLARRIDDVMGVPKKLAAWRDSAARLARMAGPLGEFLRAARGRAAGSRR